MYKACCNGWKLFGSVQECSTVLIHHIMQLVLVTLEKNRVELGERLFCWEPSATMSWAPDYAWIFQLGYRNLML